MICVWPDYPAFARACDTETECLIDPTALQSWLDRADVDERYRLAVHLRVCESATYDEIAELLELRPGQARWRVLYSRELLRRHQEQLPEDEESSDLRTWLVELLAAFRNAREGPQHTAQLAHPRLVTPADLEGRGWRVARPVRASERGW